VGVGATDFRMVGAIKTEEQEEESTRPERESRWYVTDADGGKRLSEKKSSEP